jgi:hypothetical protein
MRRADISSVGTVTPQSACRAVIQGRNATLPSIGRQGSNSNDFKPFQMISKLFLKKLYDRATQATINYHRFPSIPKVFGFFYFVRGRTEQGRIEAGSGCKPKESR